MGHWYKNDGDPLYEITKPDGTMRDTTLRDARKLNLVPSVTTILQLLDKPGLNVWKENQLLDACWEWEECSTYEEWKKQVKQIASTIGRESAKRGTEIHDSLEQAYKNNVISEDPFIAPVLELMEKEFPGVSWIAEESFCAGGVGGKVDLHSRWPVKALNKETGEEQQLGENGIVLDFKTKITADKKKMVGTDDHCMQLAAYREGLGLPHAACYNLYISTESPGILHLQKWDEKDLARCGQMFKHLYEYWCLSNKFGDRYAN